MLNVGLSAGILDTRTFSMFVLHALVLTFITTPLTLAFYPKKIRGRLGASNAASRNAGGEAVEGSTKMAQAALKTRFSVVLEKIEQLPAVMSFAQLLQPPAGVPSTPGSQASFDEKASHPVMPPGLSYQQPQGVAQSGRTTLNVLRLIELTSRTSAALKSHFAESLIQRDPILAIVRSFGSLNRFVVSTALAIVGYDEFAEHVADHVKKTSSQMLVLPWCPSSASLEDVSVSESSNSINLSSVQAQTIRSVFVSSSTDTAIFVDRGLSQEAEEQTGQHIFLPFVGGPDDRLALSFVVQLCANPSTTATIVRFTKAETHELTLQSSIEKPEVHHTVSVSLFACSLLIHALTITSRRLSRTPFTP